MKYIFIAAVVIATLWLEYTKGFMIYKRKVAVAFIGHTGRNGAEFSFTACTGIVKFGRVLQAGRYEFTSDIDLSDGDVRIEINKGKETFAVLTPKKSKARLSLPKGRYTIVTRYKKASGTLKVQWNMKQQEE